MNEMLQSSNTFQLIGHKPWLLGFGLIYWCINIILKEKQQIENNEENCTLSNTPKFTTYLPGIHILVQC